MLCRDSGAPSSCVVGLDHSRPSKIVHRGYTAIDESMSHGNVVTSTHVLLRDLVCVNFLSIK